MKVRYCTSDDFEKVYLLINQLEGTVFDREQQALLFQGNLANEQIIYLVAEAEIGVVGFLGCHVQRLLHHSDAVAEIQELVVDVEHRSGGIGAALIHFLEEELIKRRVRFLEVTSNKLRERAHRFYEEQDFVASHKKFTKILPL